MLRTDSTRTARLAVALAISAALLLPSEVSLADPPPWAPAHGWRKQNDPNYQGYTGKKWDRDYGVVNGRCNLQAVGAVVGATVGGAVGSQVGQGEGRVIATVLGTVLGAAVGSKIGRDFDNADRGCIGHTLELVGDGRSVRWANPQTGMNYVITPTRGFESGGRKCREFTTRVTSGGRAETLPGRACRAGDGTWQIVS
jgi:surface antigen